MAEFTKEQLIEQAKWVRANLAPLIKSADADHAETMSKNDRLMEIALAVLTAKPVMYAMEGEHLDAEATSTCKAVVDGWVQEWNEVDRSPGEPFYKTVALYRLPEVK